MLIPITWLKDFVDIKLPPRELFAKLSEAGLTVEKFEDRDGDIIFDPEVTPNRPDWLSVLGVAREIAAVTNTRLKILNHKRSLRAYAAKSKIINPKVHPEITIKVRLDLCPRYTVVIIKGVRVRPSPDWMQKRLKLVGLRPINNLVDITNYVMWELGNPLHVFDLDKIRGKQIIMDQAKGGEVVRSLDDIDYKVPEGTIIIKDVGRVIDLCGIKGGENTAVDSTTKNVLIHAPVYVSKYIRRASQALNLRSDASGIYEKGASLGGTLDAIHRAVHLTLEHAGGLVSGPLIDIFESEPKPWTVTLSHQKLERVMGIKIEPKMVRGILTRLGLLPHESHGSYEVSVPTLRQDLKIGEDLIEEVVRLYGYNRLPKTLPSGEVPLTKVAYSRDYDLEYDVKQKIKSAGYSEIYTYSLIAEKQLRLLGIDPAKTLRLTNPISLDFEYLRPNLFGNLLEALKLNLPNFNNVQLFELGKKYAGEALDKVSEEYWIWGGLAGERFFEAKGTVEMLLESLGITYVLRPLSKDDNFHWLHPSRTAIIQSIKGAYLGFIGQVHPDLAGSYGIKKPLTVWKINYDLLEKLVEVKKKYHPVPKYPPIIEDLTLIIPPGVYYADVVDTIMTGSKLVSSVSLIDSHDQGKTLRIEYLDPTKNLTDQEVSKVRDKIIANLKKELKVTVKS